jgi:hypothetical protein
MKIEKKTLSVAFIIALSWISLTCPAQQQAIPNAVTTHFTNMFPEAKKIEWRNKSDNIQVIFWQKNMQCEAKFKPDGRWLSTERQISTDSIPDKIRKALKSNDYTGWSVLKTFIVQAGDNTAQYRLVVSNKEMSRKLLCFDRQGQPIRNKLSL